MKFSTSLVKFGSVGDLALEMKKALTAIAAGWNVEHNPDGTHKESVTGVRLHAPTHSSGGSDPVTVTSLAGYPGSSTTFLRGDHTFAAIPAATPAAHHATHEQGGSDVVLFSTGVFERGRSVAMGEWIDVPFTAANFTTPTGGATWVVTAANYSYMLIGKTVALSLVIPNTGTVTGAPVRFKVTLPFTPNRNMGGAFIYTVSATSGAGLWSVDAGVGTIDLLRDVFGTTFPAGIMYLYVQFVYSIA